MSLTPERYTAGPGEMYSKTGLAAGTGAMYSTTEAGAAYTVGAGEMCSMTRAATHALSAQHV